MQSNAKEEIARRFCYTRDVPSLSPLSSCRLSARCWYAHVLCAKVHVHVQHHHAHIILMASSHSPEIDEELSLLSEQFGLLDMLREQHVDAARSLMYEVTLVCSVEALAMLSAVRHIQL